MVLKKKTLKKNPSYRKPISYSTEFRLDNNFVGKFCSARINAFQDIFCWGGDGSLSVTDMQTYIQSLRRVLEDLSLLTILQKIVGK